MEKSVTDWEEDASTLYNRIAQCCGNFIQPNKELSTTRHLLNMESQVSRRCYFCSSSTLTNILVKHFNNVAKPLKTHWKSRFFEGYCNKLKYFVLKCFTGKRTNYFWNAVLNALNNNELLVMITVYKWVKSSVYVQLIPAVEKILEDLELHNWWINNLHFFCS